MDLKVDEVNSKIGAKFHMLTGRRVEEVALWEAFAISDANPQSEIVDVSFAPPGSLLTAIVEITNRAGVGDVHVINDYVQNGDGSGINIELVDNTYAGNTVAILTFNSSIRFSQFRLEADAGVTADVTVILIVKA